MAPTPDDERKVDLSVQVERLVEEEREEERKRTRDGDGDGETAPCLYKEVMKEKDGGKEEEELPMLEMLAKQSRFEVLKGSERDGEEGQLYSPAAMKERDSGCCTSTAIGPYARQMTMTLMACLAGMSVGMIHAYPAVALPRWEEEAEDFNLTTAQTTWFASTPMVVSMIACTGSGMFVEYLGTRRALLLSVPFLEASWIMIALSREFWFLQVARVIQGALASVYMVAITVYPAEVSVPRWRGMTMCVAEASVMLGVFLTYVGGLVMRPEDVAYCIAASIFPMAVCFYFLRDAPLWLARKGRQEDMLKSLACLRGPLVDIRPELEQIKMAVDTELARPTASEQVLLLRKQMYFKPLVLSILVLLFKELTGQYSAMAYTVNIFKMAGSSLDPYLCTVVMGAARFLPCFLSWVLIDRLPRRTLLSSCMTLAAFSLATLGTFLWYWLRYEGGVPVELGWVPLACLLVFTLAFGAGVGTTSWTLVAELLPSEVRNVGAGIINTVFSLFLFLVGMSFPFLVEAVGVGAVFLLYASCSLMGALFVVTCLPETRGRSFAEIQRSLGNDNTI